jgi:hypothetical protein
VAFRGEQLGDVGIGAYLAPDRFEIECLPAAESRVELGYRKTTGSHRSLIEIAAGLG